MFRKIFYTLSVAALSACAGGLDGNTKGGKIVVNAADDNTAAIAPKVEITGVTPLAGDVAVGEIHKTIMWNDRYYLFSKNDKAITCFDVEGRYLFRIAAQGRGPQEYVGITNFFIDESDRELKVLSLDGDLVSFSPDDGHFLSRESTGHMMINDAFAVDDQTTALMIPGPEWNIEIRRKGQESTHLLPFNESRDFVIARKRFSREKRNVFMTYGQDDNIYAFTRSADGRDTMQVAYSVDFGPLAISAELYDNPDAVMARQEAGDFASNMDDLNVTPDYVTFSYWHFTASGFTVPNVIFDRKTGTTYNFSGKDFYLLPAAATLPDGSFVSLVHPIAILGDGAVKIPAVNSAMQSLEVADDANPLLITWRLRP